jgi:SAM-dependent methyltransferase
MQLWNWILSLRELKTQCRIFIHYLPKALSDKNKADFRSLGATLVEITPFGTNVARYCNKIRQLENPDLLDADFVILSDADIAFLRDPALLTTPYRFRAKTVDGPNPPEELWAELFVRAGLPGKVGTVPLELEPGVQTFSTNFNGGLYVMPAAMAHTLLPLWRKYANFSLAQGDLLGNYLHHSDQLGIGLGLVESGILIEPLAAGANLPTHLSKERLLLLAKQELSGLHYHGHVDQHGLPREVGIEWIDTEINRLRGILTAQRRDNFLNDIFWDFRYAHFPELGSGLGSRDEVLAYKQDLLRPYIKMIGEGTIIDVGCGDLEVFAPLPAVNYTGIDVSEEALAVARGKRPEWTFEFRSISDFEASSFDYCSCIDVLIHQPNEHDAKALVQDLVRVARKGVIFSVHSVEIEGAGISFNSSNLKDYVASRSEISAIYEVGSYRDVTLYFAEKGLGERYTEHDAGLQELAIGAQSAVDLDRLNELVAFSRERIGFFPRAVIRMHEYPWFVDKMRDCAGKHILDVGAGV